MGQGLGKNSPVRLTLGRENYEALLDRHGQWIRWRVAQKCPCVSPQTFQPDIHCTRCHGRGYTYTYQPSQILMLVVMARSTDGILELDEEYKKDTLIKVYDTDGNIYENAEKLCNYVKLNVTTLKGSYYNIVLLRDNVNTLTNVELTKCSDGYYLVPGLTNNDSTIDGVYYTAPSDIIRASDITDAEGNNFEVEELRLNKILLAEKTEETTDDEGNTITKTVTPVEPLTAGTVEYIKPYTFAILSQNLSKGDLAAMTEVNGDAVLTFPYSCDVSENDILTVFAGTTTQKDVISRSAKNYDELPAYFVESIVSIIDSDGNKYTEGSDFILMGTNCIKWLNDAIETGTGYSVTYKIYPTYTVLKDIPQLRSSENQRFPKKAVVKYMSSYASKKGVNRQ